MTEQENLQAIQSMYAAFGRGDIQAVLDGLTDDVEWILPGPTEVIPFAGVRRGREQVRQFFGILADRMMCSSSPRLFFIRQRILKTKVRTGSGSDRVPTRTSSCKRRQ